MIIQNMGLMAVIQRTRAGVTEAKGIIELEKTFINFELVNNSTKLKIREQLHRLKFILKVKPNVYSKAMQKIAGLELLVFKKQEFLAKMGNINPKLKENIDQLNSIKFEVSEDSERNTLLILKQINSAQEAVNYSEKQLETAKERVLADF